MFITHFAACFIPPQKKVFFFFEWPLMTIRGFLAILNWTGETFCKTHWDSLGLEVLQGDSEINDSTIWWNYDHTSTASKFLLSTPMFECYSRKQDTYPSDITDLTDIPKRNWHIYNHPTTSSLPKMGWILPQFYHRPIHSWSWFSPKNTNDFCQTSEAWARVCCGRFLKKHKKIQQRSKTCYVFEVRLLHA